MSKMIWLIHHYIAPPEMGSLNRHYYFMKHLMQSGYGVRIFASSHVHNSDVNLSPDGKTVVEKTYSGMPYVFVPTSSYAGNGLARIRNMVQFPMRLSRVSRRYPRPDAVYATSMSLLAAWKGLRMARKYKVPCLLEIRDLWPEVLIAYGVMGPRNPVVLAMRALEKWMYKKADRIVFTMNGMSYLKERGWENQIEPSKVTQVNNGVDIRMFEEYRANNRIDDPDLDDPDTIKVVYTGSIRQVNSLGLLVDAAKLVWEKGERRVRFLIWGRGDQEEALRARVRDEGIQNVKFKGFVGKEYIPGIVSRADINFVHNRETPIMRFGMSMNKVFDYMAAGKPILYDIMTADNPVEQYGCGVTISGQTSEKIADAVIEMANMDEDTRARMCEGSLRGAREYDYVRLSERIEAILASMIHEWEESHALH